MRAITALSATGALACMWVLVGCGSEAPTDEAKLGTATLAMVNTPPDARCAQITIAGETTETRTFPLVPAQPAVFALDDLPTGLVTFSEQVFTQACASIGTNTPKWASNEVEVELEAGVDVDVYLTLSLYGEGPGATIHTDFPDATVSFETISLAAYLYALVVASDDNVWASGYDSSISSSVALRITPAGVVTQYLTTDTPYDLIAGSDGNIWGGTWDGKVVRTNISSGVMTTVSSSPTSAFYRGTAGPDGNVWFTDYTASALVRVSITGTLTSYPLPAASSYPYAIATGADGRFWVGESGPVKIARVTTTGTVTEFTPPSPNAYTDSITAGPDGNVWFTESGNAKVARITPTGTIKEYSTLSNVYPYMIVAGSDGNLWVTGSGVVTRVTTAGVMKDVPLPNGYYPNDIVAGPDAKLWMAVGNSILRFDPNDVP